MAKVHKARKSTQKYSFQKKKVNVKTLLIVLAVVIVAAIGLKIAYDNYVYGEFEVAAPEAAKLNAIAENWELLNADTEHFMNYYNLMGYSTDGTDGNGGVMLIYTGNDAVDEVSLQINTLGTDDAETPVEVAGLFGRTSLTNFINGVAPWGQTAMQIIAGTESVSISVYDADVETLDSTLLDQILDEIAAIIEAGPIVTEEPVEEPAEESTEVVE